MDKLFIEDLEVTGKKVLMRVDFNVPLDVDTFITDATRIEAALPSIHSVLNRGGSLILMSHLGRPEGAYDPELSLKPVAKFLSGILKKEVQMAPDCIGHTVKTLVAGLKSQDILLLENLRFHIAEEHPERDVSFAKELASFGDCYVNDAFGSSHRKHSSTYTIAEFFPHMAAAGYLLTKEVRYLDAALKNPARPFHALIGGAKISTKTGVLRSLLNHVDTLLIGGAMSYTFLKAMGKEIGHSPCEDELLSIAKEIIAEAKEKGVPLFLPVDMVVAKSISEDAPSKVVEEVPIGYQGVDVGPKTIALYKQRLGDAQTILWNGPVGIFELENFAKGTKELAKAIAASSATTIVGGGDTIAAINEWDLASSFSHVSTGGGATLEYIEHGTLPGIEVLSSAQKVT